MFVDGALPTPRKVKKGPDIPWVRPLPGWLKLSIDGSFYAEDKYYWYVTAGYAGS
jgi:hypothetical protein